MSVEIKVPMLPESVADAVVAKWYKQEGDTVSRDENLVDLETDKVMLEVPSPQAGVISKIAAAEGATVVGGDLLVVISESTAADTTESKVEVEAPTPAEAEPSITDDIPMSPAVRRLLAEHDISTNELKGSGHGGRVTKQDVLNYIKDRPAESSGALNETVPASPAPVSAAVSAAPIASSEQAIVSSGARTEKRVAMSRLRSRIAERLLESQQTAAILSTFNEVNMQPVMDLRAKYKADFEKKHGVRLGFMSFFVKAVVEALKAFPEVNAFIDGSDIIYHDYCDVGIAIGGGKMGLVVPILRNAETMGMADIEGNIRGYAEKAKTGKITLDEMTGGTFSITNGGVYGSMLSTPIINPPQSAILGMHNIVERPVAENGEIVIRPMMYLALSYDHRLVDGKSAISFLVAIKNSLEDPARMLLDV